MPIEQPPARARGPAGRLMTRRQLAQYLTKHGYPIALATLNQACMPSGVGGLEPEGFWGAYYYDPQKALQWVRERFRRLPRDRKVRR
jgi:hypothetical protein